MKSLYDVSQSKHLIIRKTYFGDLENACLHLGRKRRRRIVWLESRRMNEDKHNDEVQLTYIRLQFDWVPGKEPEEKSYILPKKFVVAVFNRRRKVLTCQIIEYVNE